MENMQLFQKPATTMSTTSPMGVTGQRTMRKTLMMRHSRRVMTKIFTKKSLIQVEKENVWTGGDQNSQDRVTLHPSDSDIDLSEESICQRKDYEDPLSKHFKVDSDAEVEGGDQDNSYKDLLPSVQEDFGPPIDTKLADVL